MSSHTLTVSAKQLQVGDEFSDGTYVEEVFDDDYEGIWLATDGAYEDAGYVEPGKRFKITRHFDE
jgi:hypothetical protein